jgi:hypothetical protein
MAAWRAGVLTILLLGAAVACERATPEAELPPQTGQVPPAAPPDPTLYPVEIKPGTAIAVRKVGSREYTFYGGTDRADEIRLSVEDGHNVLFGPAAIPVDEGRFRIDFLIEPTDRTHIFFYVTDAAGKRLAVVPVDTAREVTTAGPATLLPSMPGLTSLRMGDRRTRVTADSLESPHFRVRRPQVRIGDRAIRVSGETNLSHFRTEVRRRDQLLVHQQPRVAGSPSEWNTFATELVVPDGVREGDAVLLAPATEEAELVFQPIRN